MHNSGPTQVALGLLGERLGVLGLLSTVNPFLLLLLLLLLVLLPFLFLTLV